MNEMILAEENEFYVPRYPSDVGEMIDINYAPGKSKTKPIPRVDVVSSLLFDKRKDVVIFGEGNFTFAIALAAARNTYFIERLKVAMANVGCNVPALSCNKFIEECLAAVRHRFWEGITVTYYEPEHSKNYNFYKAIAANKFEIEMLGKKKICSNLFDLTCKIISSIPPPDPSRTIQYRVDATTTADPSLTTKDVVWFQCPWVTEYLPELIHDFMKNLSKWQNSGQYLLIGICNLFPYVTNYMLQYLGIFNNDSIIHGYRFIGGDTAAIGKLLHLGYCHEGLSDIHYKIFDHHVTLVFKKT